MKNAIQITLPMKNVLLYVHHTFPSSIAHNRRKTPHLRRVPLARRRFGRGKQPPRSSVEHHRLVAVEHLVRGQHLQPHHTTPRRKPHQTTPDHTASHVQRTGQDEGEHRTGQGRGLGLNVNVCMARAGGYTHLTITKSRAHHITSGAR